MQAVNESPALAWYAVHTKPRQEARAYLNLAQQGYPVFLPLLTAEKVSRHKLVLKEEPLFPRYLFIELDTARTGRGWSAIRSTLGVSGLVTFGSTPAKISAHVIEQLRAYQQAGAQQPQRLFHNGDRLAIVDGPFAGLEAVYQLPSGEDRALVLIEWLGKQVPLQVPPASLRQAA